MQRKLRYGRFIALILLILTAALIINPAMAPANDDDALNEWLARQQDSASNMKKLEKQIAAGRELKSQYDRDMMALDVQLVALGQDIQAANAAIGTLNSLIDEANTAIALATEHLNERQAYLESRLLDIYINGDITMLDVFFNAASFDEFIVLFDWVDRIMVQDKEVLEDIRKVREDIEAEKARLTKLKADQEVILADLEERNAELARLHEEKARATNELNLSLAQAQANYDAEVRAAAEATDMIKKILAARPKQNYYGGTFVWPLPSPSDKSKITSPYGMRFHPILKKNAMHTGIDIGASGGTEIYAAGAGEIIFQGWNGGYGNCVMVDHGGGIVTLYAHMSRFSNKGEGSDVLSYDVIGYVGSTGQSTGNHLHFEVRVNGDHVNPASYLGI